MNEILMADPVFSSDSFRIFTLHSMVSPENQIQVFDRPPPGVRKIVLSTNVAETSITIDDVVCTLIYVRTFMKRPILNHIYFSILKVFVIDSGKNKQSCYDPQRNLDLLQTDWVSLASANQRMGRAGRTQPGVCYRLYSCRRESTFVAHPVPEMKRVRLEGSILQLKMLHQGKAGPFFERAPEPPEKRTVQLSLELLGKIGVLDSMEQLTPLGFHIARIPTDCRIAKVMIFGAIFGCLQPALNIAAVLSLKSPFLMSHLKDDTIYNRKKVLDGKLNSDHLLLSKILSQHRSKMELDEKSVPSFCEKNYLNEKSMADLQETVDQYCRNLYDLHFVSSARVTDPAANVNSDNVDLIRAVLCAGFHPNIAVVAKEGAQNITFDLYGKRRCHNSLKLRQPKIRLRGYAFQHPTLVYFKKMFTTSDDETHFFF